MKQNRYPDREFIDPLDKLLGVGDDDKTYNFNISDIVEYLGTLGIGGNNTSGSIIKLNQGEQGDGVSTNFAGMQINRGTLTNQGFVYDSDQDKWSTGDFDTLDGQVIEANENSFTLDEDASDVDDIYNGKTVFIFRKGEDTKSVTITDYDGDTKVATISPGLFFPVPDNTWRYRIFIEKNLKNVATEDWVVSKINKDSIFTKQDKIALDDAVEKRGKIRKDAEWVEAHVGQGTSTSDDYITYKDKLTDELVKLRAGYSDDSKLFDGQNTDYFAKVNGDSTKDFAIKNASIAENLITKDYTKGILGKGFSFDKNGDGALQNLEVFQAFRVNTFVNNKININNGDLIVSDSATIDILDDNSSTAFFEGQHPFKIGDTIKCKQLSSDNTSLDVYYMNIIATGQSTTHSGYSYIEFGKTGVGTPRKGDLLVRWSGGLLYLSSNGDDAPYIQAIKDGVVEAQFGNLDNINDPVLGNLTGFGIASSNVNLKGKFKLVNGDDVGDTFTSIATNINGMESSIKQNADKIALTVTKDNVLSTINVSTEGITIAANKINIDGVVQQLNIKKGITALGAVTAGSFNIGSGKFGVTAEGKLTANDAIVAGWNVDSDSIFAGTKATDLDNFNSQGGITLNKQGAIVGKNIVIAPNGDVKIKGQMQLSSGSSIDWGDVNNTPSFADPEIGGRNYIRNSKLDKPADNITLGSVCSYVNNSLFLNNQPYYTSSSGYTGLVLGDLSIGEEYVFSVDINSNISNGKLQLDFDGSYDQSHVYETKDGHWNRYVIKFTAIASGNAILALYAPLGDVFYGYLRNMKLEKGNVATDWTPAPEDTEEKLTHIDENGIYTGSLTTQQLNSARATILGNVSAGSFNLGNGKFQVSTDGKLRAIDASISGKISASEGDIGGFSITNDSLTAKVTQGQNFGNVAIVRPNTSSAYLEIDKTQSIDGVHGKVSDVSNVKIGLSGGLFGSDENRSVFRAEHNADRQNPLGGDPYKDRSSISIMHNMIADYGEGFPYGDMILKFQKDADAINLHSSMEISTSGITTKNFNNSANKPVGTWYVDGNGFVKIVR